MSKVEELRVKYQNVSPQTFTKFVDSDKTQTKKYLEFILKTWLGRATNNCPKTTSSLIELVQKFDALLPFIQNKDIYHKDYSDISLLKLVIARAEEIKEEKSFVREEHVNVLDETEDYILLEPLTHRGSLKYGANTKWCTASRRDESTFNRYRKSGLLAYLIDKKGNRDNNYKKIAFYSEYNRSSAYSSDIIIYNSSDNNVQDFSVISNGWSEDEIFKITMIYRIYFSQSKKTKKSKDYVDKFTSTLSTLDFKTLIGHLEILEQNKKIDYISNLQEKINNILKDLNESNYARFTETKS